MTKTIRTRAVIVLIICLICVAATSVFVFANKKTNNASKSTDKTGSFQSTSSNSGDQSTQDTDEDAPTSQSTPHPSNQVAGSYLEIKEWGVRFQLPQELRGDVSYEIRDLPDIGRVAYFEVGKISELPGGSNCKLSTPGGDGIGTYLWRSLDATPQETIAYHRFANKVIKGYFYTGGREKYSDDCMADEAYRQFTLDAIGSLTQSLTSLEAIP